jgi:predicted RNase H-like HicB family nuclease
VTLKVLIHKAEEGGYWAEVPALPGCVSQGETVDDVRTNIREAIEGWLLAEEGTTQEGAAMFATANLSVSGFDVRDQLSVS